MARTQGAIYAAIVSNYVTVAGNVGIVLNPAAFGTANQWATAVNAPFASMYNLQGLIMWIIAGGAAITEQLWDAFTALIQSLIAIASPQTFAWFQAQMLKFQFDATTPQIIQFDTTNFAPSYPIVNANFQVIKYCSVVPGIFGTTLIKVAAQVGGFPADLNTTFPGALAAAQSYALLLGVPGIQYNVQSGNSDKIYIQATIYYQGGYSSVIPGAGGTVIAAIQNYLATIPFNGVVLLSNLEAAIKAVPGVNDYVPNNVQARADGTSYGSGTNLVVANATVARLFNTISGYIIGETHTGATLVDSLTFIPE